MGPPLGSASPSSSRDFSSKSLKSSSSPRNHKTTTRSAKPTRSSSRLASKRLDLARLTPSPSVSSEDSDVTMSGSNNHNSTPRYGTSPSSMSDSSQSQRASSQSSNSTAASSATGVAHDANCHFAYSAELQLVDNLVSMLAQNNAGSSNNQRR